MNSNKIIYLFIVSLLVFKLILLSCSDVKKYPESDNSSNTSINDKSKQPIKNKKKEYILKYKAIIGTVNRDNFEAEILIYLKKNNSVKKTLFSKKVSENCEITADLIFSEKDMQDITNSISHLEIDFFCKNYAIERYENPPLYYPTKSYIVTSKRLHYLLSKDLILENSILLEPVIDELEISVPSKYIEEEFFYFYPEKPFKKALKKNKSIVIPLARISEELYVFSNSIFSFIRLIVDKENTLLQKKNT